MGALSVWSGLLVLGYTVTSVPPPRPVQPAMATEAGMHAPAARFGRAAANNELAIRHHEDYGARRTR